MPILPPEARLVLLATRSPGVATERALGELLGEPMNWRLVGDLAEREKLLPVLWTALRGHTESVPPEIAERIHAQAAVTEFRMAMTETTLLGVVERLDAKGIPVMLLKGAALATTVYPSFAARPMGDLDILVPPNMAQQAWQCLVDAGWKKELSGGDRFYEGHHHLVGLVDPHGLHLVLEIHRAMLPTAGPFLLSETELWREARPVTLGGGTVWVPSARHQLLHLSVHLAWSNMLLGGLGRTARDVAKLLEADPLDWAQFVGLARGALAGSCAYWTLRMARSLAGAPVPAPVLAELRPPGIMPVAAPLERALIASALTGACPSIQFMRLLWSAAIRPRASGHGEARPWRVGEAFRESFPTGQPIGWRARVRAHLKGWRSWLRFAGILGLPRRVI